jgi:hypothetical protein
MLKKFDKNNPSRQIQLAFFCIDLKNINQLK